MSTTRCYITLEHWFRIDVAFREIGCKFGLCLWSDGSPGRALPWRNLELSCKKELFIHCVLKGMVSKGHGVPPPPADLLKRAPKSF